jgi:hypothetical protein
VRKERGDDEQEGEASDGDSEEDEALTALLQKGDANGVKETKPLVKAEGGVCFWTDLIDIRGTCWMLSFFSIYLFFIFFSVCLFVGLFVSLFVSSWLIL